MIVLGIETSCDETAAALVTDDRRVLAEAVLSQIDDHRPFGGVVPELAARSHIDHLDHLIERVMQEASIGFADLGGVAATAGPGLIGGVIVGLMTAKAIAAVHACRFAAVNHLEAHALSPRLLGEVAFPYLVLLISGGHCQLLVVEGVGRYRRLGTTIDDAVGEAFDKVAKMLGLGYPGGPALEAAAVGGDARRFSLPRPLIGRAGCDFSFAGLKTAVMHLVRAKGRLVPDEIRDLAASFQKAVGDVLCDRTRQALALYRDWGPATPTLVVAGGVAANQYLRTRIERLAAEAGVRLAIPPPRLCTDNATMVAWAGIERIKDNRLDTLAAPARARWPLDPAAAPGAKA
ncbi:MAG: tRNA (adenosine(37)-N6)-threonylcarbamoyltransferase complex transferase subunit TsaD [Alphaproteobacteria bacterium]|nr:tRNA (adenosine(37)-N6)-threonylcarbamoyltransferase complex transferase subunit TsaD [Alphaproteobacteria bacterium]